MGDLILHTYDWVPPGPRGYVRDLRVRWALLEGGLPHRIATTPFRDRAPDHLAHQPFNQVPWLTDGDLSIFESGAILLHLGRLSPALMPTDTAGRAEVTQWVLAALNSVEVPVLGCIVMRFAGDDLSSPGGQALARWRTARLQRLEGVLAARPWLAGAFSVADILMADILRAVVRFDDATALDALPACRAYLARASARPAFQQAHADQMTLFTDP